MCCGIGMVVKKNSHRLADLRPKQRALDSSGQGKVLGYFPDLRACIVYKNTEISF